MWPNTCRYIYLYKLALNNTPNKFVVQFTPTTHSLTAAAATLSRLILCFVPDAIKMLSVKMLNYNMGNFMYCEVAEKRRGADEKV